MNSFKSGFPDYNHNVIIIDDSNPQPRRKPMTICLAIACDSNSFDNGDPENNIPPKRIPPKVILVGDRMITMRGLDIEFEHPKTKLTQITKYCVAATAGDALVITEIVDAVKQKLKLIKHKPQIHDIALIFKDTFVELRRKKIEDKLLKPIGIESLDAFYKDQQQKNTGLIIDRLKKIEKYDYNIQILIGGADNSGAHIFAIDNPGMIYNLDEMGYDAIGSGNTHALLTIIGANYHSDTSFEEALYLAYKAKRMAEKAPGIGTIFTDIWVVENDATYEIPQGNKNVKEGEIKIGLARLEEMYEEELKQTKIPFDKLAEITKTKVKRDEPEFLKGYS
jgi:20S proteasome alpha/beta subunit